MPTQQPTIIEHIVDQHFEEAAFLWAQRNAAVNAPHYNLKDLAHLDDRLEAHIDGLRVARDPGWAICENGLDPDNAGTVFSAGLLAFENGSGERIDKAIAAGGASLEGFRGLVSAMGWLGDEPFDDLLPALLRANSRAYRRLGIAACGVRRFDPGKELDEALNSSDLFLKLRALKTAGEIKRRDLLPALREHFQHENQACRFAAAYAALLMGDSSALDTMLVFVFATSPLRPPALNIALRAANPQTAHDWLRAISRDPEQMRDVLIGTGIIGDPVYIPTLIARMEIPELARVAGEAFSMITGVDLAYQDLDGDWPDGFEAGPNDDPDDENVEMDADEDLPWPDINLVNQWWDEHKSDFSAGTRHLAGKPVSPEQCDHVLKNGTQRQRNAAALELALVQPDAPFFNTRAPGFWQEKRL